MNITITIFTIIVIILLIKIAILEWRLDTMLDSFNEIELKPTQEQLDRIIEIMEEGKEKDE